MSSREARVWQSAPAVASTRPAASPHHSLRPGGTATGLTGDAPADGSQRRLVVIMPAYNAERTLQRTYDDLPHGQITEVILVDDGSRDGTVAVARRLGLTAFRHERNFGYGANQKTCYAEALRAGATTVAMVHPDYQYDPTLLPDLVRPIEEGAADVVFGSRLKGSASPVRLGMPWWKYGANRALTWLENRIFGLGLSEYHTGYRAYSRSVLERVNFRANSDGFIFDQEIVAQIVECGLRVQEIAVPVRYFPEASSASFRASVTYGLGILLLLARYCLHRSGTFRQVQFACLADRYRPAW